MNFLINNHSYSTPTKTTSKSTCLCAGKLVSGKSSGIDSIPAEIFKYVGAPNFQFLSSFVNGFICLSHVPRVLMEAFLNTVIKTSQKDYSDRGNYRPKAVGTRANKLIERMS